MTAPEKNIAENEALALLRERFPEPWRVDVFNGVYGAKDIWRAVARFTEPRLSDDIRLCADGPDALAAARACIAAWDEATKDELVCCMEGHEPISLSSKRPCPLCAERARVADRDAWLSVIADHCDRMAPMPDGRRAHDNKRPIEQHVGMVLSYLTGRVAVLEAALYPLVTEGLDADAREDAPEFDGDEIYTGLRALPQCAKCVGTGSTDDRHYVDVPIPEAVVCPDCFGRGFTMHPFKDAAGALDG